MAAEQILGIYGPAYFSHEKYGDRATLRRENRRRLRLMQRYVRTPAARVLEAGCGTGDFISVAKCDYAVSGFDVSAHAVDMARRANPDIADRIRCSDLARVELPSTHFDGVCLWDVIEHLWDVEAACRRLLDTLKPGGVLLLSTPDSGSWGARALGRYWPLMTPPEHASFFSATSLAYLFEDRLNATVVHSTAMGKWVNLRFALRKVQRLMTAPGTAGAVARCQRLLPETLSIYLPSRDIRYVVVRKAGGGGA
jgi:2-polyprenyl-3-methyl-5-hydroxy-6-metoxy-1,4-benzoquinol methylase